MEERMKQEECPCIMKEESQRVKGIAFHPSKKILITGLHSGVIQGWNYLYKTKIFELNEHEGPVRVVVFHHLVERFASAGDDCLIRIWDYKSKTVETVFKGHTDYVRSIEFHKHLPWLISTSDDQTIRIWNFQSKKQIACLTGHTHYVMCARFINDKLFASVSLDQTIRVWDYSALVTKSQTSVMDMLGVPEVVLKHIVDGHDRGINWISVQPDGETFATGGDDSTIRIWSVGQDGIQEKDTLQGHHSHISSLYYTKSNTLLSNSEDGTLKIWDLKNRKPIKTLTIEGGRYWCLAMDQEENIFAAGHDTGFSIYSIGILYPVYAVYDGILYICKDTELNKIEEGKISKLMSIQKDVREIFVRKDTTIINFPGKYTVCNGSKARYKGLGFATFIDDRVAVCTDTEISIRELDGRDVVSYSIEADKVFEISGGLLAQKGNSLFKIENGSVLVSALLPDRCLYVRFDQTHIVAVCKNSIVVLDYNLVQISVIDEIVAINSLIVKDGTIFYTTPLHIKFAFMNGEGSSFMSIDEALWIVSVEDTLFTLVAADGSVIEIEVDMIEWKFRKALEDMDMTSIRECIDTGSLIGQASLSCLIRKGFYEEGLNYVEDTGVRLELSIKTKKFEDALKYAKELHSPEVYIKTGKAAINYDIRVAEECFKLAKEFSLLLLLYISSGKLDKIESLLFECTDEMYCAIAAIITGNKETLCKLISLQSSVDSIDVLDTEVESSTKSDTVMPEVPKEDSSNECIFMSESQDTTTDVDSEDIQSIKELKGAPEISASAAETDDAKTSSTVFPSLNMERLQRCIKTIPSKIDIDREIKVAKECAANGKVSTGISSFLIAIHYLVNSMNEKGRKSDEEMRSLKSAAEYLQGLFSEKIRKAAQSDKTSISCAIFYASLDLERTHKEKALKAAILTCYKKGNKHYAMELSREIVNNYGCTDERIKMLADSHKPMKDTYVIDTSLPFCIDIGEYAEDANQCQICSAWSSSRCKTCACCFISNL
ncbi:coatomer subunit alpha [Nematocida sp. AWRm78]|nr:coatomer subunit alpha [Nematocida sp. AWRm79]KAI5183046.1 coatomer subunit alpha [Nematocida sp. AWRm78]